MRNFVGILILVLVVIVVLEFYHRNNESKLNSDIQILELKISSKDKSLDSLQAVIRKGRTSIERSRIVGRSANSNEILSDVKEYLNSTKLAKGYENRGKEITAKEYYTQADKYKLELMKLFSKDKVIDLLLDTENGFTHEYMFVQENWKLITNYYNSVNPQKKPEGWITDDKIVKVIENLESGKKYKVKFKVLETIHMPYSGSVSYFSFHLKYLDISEL